MGKCSKDKRDIYYRKAKEHGYRARSAYKLIQLDDTFHFLTGATRIVDLCAAPGGWSQVIIERTRSKNPIERACIVSVDLMEMAPIEGVHQIKGDITHTETMQSIQSYLNGNKAQCIVMDGAPDITELYDWDEYVQHHLVRCGLDVCHFLLDKNGTFVSKIFRGSRVAELYETLFKNFKNVTCAKPKACRNSSLEAFVVCEGFKTGRERYDSMNDVSESERKVSFRGCGDVFGDDSDQSYPLHTAKDLNNLGYIHCEPVQKPINPPYAVAMDRNRT